MASAAVAMARCATANGQIESPESPTSFLNVGINASVDRFR